MQCNCKAEVEARLLERFKAQAPDATNHAVELTGYAIGITEDNGLVLAALMPVEFQAEHPLRKGGTKLKKTRQNMHFSFCPFCGKAARAAAGAPKEGQKP